MTQAQHVAFGRRFGEVTPAHPTLPAMFPDQPEILLLDNKAIGSNEQEKSGQSLSIESRWHTDVTFVPEPADGIDPARRRHPAVRR